jgi:hypothetical protein
MDSASIPADQKTISIRGRDEFSTLILMAIPVAVVAAISFLFHLNATNQVGFSLSDVFIVALVLLLVYLIIGKQLVLSSSGVTFLGPYSGPVKEMSKLSFYGILAPKRLTTPWNDVQSVSLVVHPRRLGKYTTNSRFIVFHLKNGDYYSLGANYFGISSFKKAITILHRENLLLEEKG